MDQRTICITGMHRSGTSVAARAVDLLGVSLGQPGRLQPAGRDNPAGYWENRYITELDDEVLAALGGSWDRPPVLEPGWQHDTELEPFRARARQELDDAFGHEPACSAPIRCFKDPRLSLLLPFWRTVTPVDTTIVLVRHPADVATSLQARNGFDIAQGVVLWLRYLLAATANDPGHLLLDHQRFFDDLPATLRLLARHIGLDDPSDDQVTAVTDHLDVSLHHHRTRPQPGEAATNPVVAMGDAVWNGGHVDLDALPASVTDAIRDGWLRPPADDDELTRARAQVVELTERLRRRKRERVAAAVATSGPPVDPGR